LLATAFNTPAMALSPPWRSRERDGARKGRIVVRATSHLPHPARPVP
jgi:hypothetical protein